MRSKRHHPVPTRTTDFGPEAFTSDLAAAAIQNSHYRTALWTGKHLQLTLMSIPAGGDIGVEVHSHTDQFIYVEQGYGLAEMGAHKDRLSYRQKLRGGSAILVPAGTWHNITNTSRSTLKLYTIYAPPHHPHGTTQRTKAEAHRGGC